MLMGEFTFVVITYNQQKYIIEHLESIKNQIIKYGANYRNYLVVGDDCSTDLTLYYLEQWLKRNNDLFCKVTINKQNKNGGIVNNYLSSIKIVETEMFTIIAGDDIYADNDIYSAASQSNFVYTPRISFSSKGDVYGEDLWLFKKCMLTHKTINEEMLSFLRYKMVVDTNALIWRKLFCSTSFFQEIAKFKWIEDYPTMISILQNKNINPTLYFKPIMLYRDDSGISNNSRHAKKTEYNIEEEKCFKEYNLKCFRFPKYINPYNYIFLVKKHFFKLDKKSLKKIKEFEKAYYEEVERNSLYLKEIMESSSLLANEIQRGATKNASN